MRLVRRPGEPGCGPGHPAGRLHLRSVEERSLRWRSTALAGGVALGYEVVWSQAIVQFTSTRAFAFAVVLATYLAGLALGSRLFARFADRVRDPWGVFGLLIAAAGGVALLGIALAGRWLVASRREPRQRVLAVTGSDLAGMCARFAVAATVIVLLPTLLLGAAFPAGACGSSPPMRHVRDGIGRVACAQHARRHRRALR